MIVVRDVFRLKFGQAKPALAAWKEMLAAGERARFTGAPRILTDLVGPYYTIVFETTFPSLGDFEREAQRVMANEEWRAAYGKIVPLVESGYREIFTVVN